MAARSQIPETQGVSDQKTRDILTSMRTILNNITGRNGGTIQTLNANADLGGVINKVNEILLQIQDAPNTHSNIPSPITLGKVVAQATFNVTTTSSALNVTSQFGMTLTRASIGTYNFTFTKPLLDTSWTSSINHARSTTWVSSGEQIYNKTIYGGSLQTLENGGSADVSQAIDSSITIFSK